MQNEIKREMPDKDKYYTDDFSGNFNRNNGDDSDYSYEHPSYDDIMKFVTANKDDILSNSNSVAKMIIHFCNCEDCKNIKNEMMQMEENFEFALDINKI